MKPIKTMAVKWIAPLASVWMMACGSAAEEPACAGDNDCKGERICEAGVCVSPSSGNEGGGGNGMMGGGQGNEGNGGNQGGMSVMPGAFGADCTEDSQCNDGPCIFRSGVSNGFCTKNCDAISECPMNYDCTVIGNASRKSCVPEDRIETCIGACKQYSFFMCLADNAESACVQGCRDATVEQRLAFTECGDPLMCTGESCFESLAPGKGPWLKDESAGCMRANTGFCDSQDKEYACSEGSSPPEDPMMPGSCQYAGVHPETNIDTYCCFSF